MDCPFCNRAINLADCPIVATNFTGGDDHVTSYFDEPAADEPAGTVTLASGRELQLGSHGWPVLYDPRTIKQSRLRRFVGSPPSLSEHSRPEDLPARLCTECHWPLPQDAGERPILTIAVLGAQGSGKTHFLASSLTAAYRDQALAPLGYDSFYPTGDTDQRFHDDYFMRVFEERSTLPANQVVDVRRSPLTFRVSKNGRDHTVLLHDISGELLANRSSRNRLAPFVHHADGVIFMIDPWGLQEVRSKLVGKYSGMDQAARGFSQTQMINSVADDIERISPARLATVPAAFAISKSDLIHEALGVGVDKFVGKDVTPQQRRAEIHDISTMVRRELLADLGEGALGPAIARFANASLHLVAALGSQPAIGQPVSEVKPSRITDPLYSVLDRIVS